MDVLEAEAQPGQDGHRHDPRPGLRRPALPPGGLRQRPDRGRRPGQDLVLDQRLLAETYGGHVLVLPDRRPALILDDAHHHDEAAGGERHFHDGQPIVNLVELLARPVDLRLHAARPRRGPPGRHRLRGDGHVRRAQGPRLHRRRRQPRGVPGPGHRLSCSGSRCTSAAPSPRSRRRSRSAVVSRRGGLRFDTAVGVLFAGMFAFGIVLFSTIEDYVADLFGYLLGNVLGITFGDLVQIAVLGAIVLVVVVVLRKELLYATFDPAGAAASGLPVDGARLPAARPARRDDRGQHPGGRDHHGRGDARDPGGDRPSCSSSGSASWSGWRSARPLLSAVIGLYLSFYLNVASGASIVLVETFLFVVALIFSPRRGLLAEPRPGRRRRPRDRPLIPTSGYSRQPLGRRTYGAA